MSDNPSKTFAGRWRADRRDEAVGATLVGLVVVLLGYASGVGAGGSGGTVAAGGGPQGIPGSPPAPASATSPVLVQAPSTSATATATDG
ncbi:MAG: hypothetical protein HOW97_22025, partial [Catenulispora sp.]|nr:hypothetical protein [Catenulispora sp.]